MSQETIQEELILVTKECNDCKESKPLNEFRTYKTGATRPRCKECEKKNKEAVIIEDDLVKKVEKDWYAMWIG